MFKILRFHYNIFKSNHHDWVTNCQDDGVIDHKYWVLDPEDKVVNNCDGSQ